MNAVVLAGGFGTRLKPLTNEIIKPMLTVCNRPILDYNISQLHYYGVKDILFTLAHKPHQITEWAIGYEGINTRFSIEETPLGTLGGVKANIDYLSDTFLVISADGICNVDLNALLNRHIATRASVTMVVTKYSNPTLYGVCSLNDGFIEHFIEKPHSITTPSYINCGIYAVNKSALNLINKDNCDFSKDLFPLLAKEKKLAYYEHIGYWQDIGDINSYYNTNFDILKLMSQNESVDYAFYPFIKNFSFNKYKSKLVGTVSPSLINTFSQSLGFINESIVSNATINKKASIYNSIVLDGANVENNHYGSIIGSNFLIDVLNLPLNQPKNSCKLSSFRV